MANPKAEAPKVAQPTFAACNLDCWDEDTNQPSKPSPYELEDPDVMASVRTDVDRFKAWWAIQTDEAETEAREAYGASAARYLVGIFPNARVSVEAYASGAGEELSRFSADIAKLVCQRARRRLKALPPIAQLVDWAEAETEKRERQWRAYEAALASHARAIAAGEREAGQIAERAAAAGLQPPMDADAVLRLHMVLTLHPMGIDPDYGNWTWKCARALFRQISHGDGAAAAHANLLLEARGQYERRDAAASTLEEQNAAWRDYEARREPLIRSLADALGMPVPDDVML
ncbi:hypothetical protein [Dankookia sp. P2]|uniref:hypothetical protein n=1 Tax=Dankookia sp. P2 TaxID=3423955 RepID=UPI003D679296